MSDPKPVELLTEAEKVPLLQAYTEGPIAMLDAVTAIVAAREAAARREALLEAAEESEMRINLANRVTSLEAKVARVEALALPDGIWKGDKHVRLTRRDRTLGCDITESYVRVDDLTAALAEPERDEESAEGSCKPGTCDAPVMCSTDAPCPRNEEGGR